MANNIVFKDNSAAVLKALKCGVEAALTECGLRAVGYARKNAPVGTSASTGVQEYNGGSLRESLTFKVHGQTCYIGTNIKSENGAPYAVYVEFGTGVYASEGNGRKSPWIWVDKNGTEHYTHGIKPTHFLRNAVQVNRDEYIRTVKKLMKSGV